MFLAEIEALLESVHTVEAPTILMERTVKLALERIQTPHDREVCYRASSIGKPWITQVLDRWASGGRYSECETRAISSMMVMTDGVVSHAWVESVFNVCQVEYNSEVTLRKTIGDIEIIGHADIVARKGSQIIVLECKSMAPHLITKFAKEPNDDFGYLSQLSFYTECVRTDNPLCQVSGAFILYNRAIGQFKVVPIIDEVIRSRVRRINSALEALSDIKVGDIETLLSTVTIPPAIGGKIPTSMKFSRWTDCLYEPSGTYGVFSVRSYDDSVKLIRQKLYK